MRALHRTFTVALAFAATAWAQSANAEEPAVHDDEAEVATTLFERAVALARAGDWEQAWVHYKRSHDAKPSPTTRYSMAVAELELGRLLAARASFHAFLAESTAPEEAGLRHAAVAALKDVASRIPTLAIRPTPAAASVSIDGTVVDRGAQAAVDPGLHSISVSADGYATRALSVPMAEGDHRVIEVTLELADADATEPGDQRVATPYGPIAFMTAGGVVATAAALLGTTTWISAADTRAGTPEADALHDRAIAADVLGGVGAACLAAGLTWLIVELVDSGSAKDAVSLEGGAFQLRF